MVDHFKGIFAVCISVMLLAICPLSMIKLRENEVRSMRAMSIAAELSEQIRKTGYVEYVVLREAAGELALLDYELMVFHEKRISEGNMINGIYVESGHGYEVHDLSDIEAVCEGGADYPLYMNDRFSVTVKNGHRQFTYGGLVLNEAV